MTAKLLTVFGHTALAMTKELFGNVTLIEKLSP
jgi:hypothetical protein